MLLLHFPKWPCWPQGQGQHDPEFYLTKTQGQWQLLLHLKERCLSTSCFVHPTPGQKSPAPAPSMPTPSAVLMGDLVQSDLPLWEQLWGGRDRDQAFLREVTKKEQDGFWEWKNWDGVFQSHAVNTRDINERTEPLAFSVFWKATPSRISNTPLHPTNLHQTHTILQRTVLQSCSCVSELLNCGF